MAAHEKAAGLAVPGGSVEDRKAVTASFYTGAQQTAITVLPIDLLHRHPQARPLNDAALAALADSIEESGLINPIRVRKIDAGYEIIAGSHRFAACDLLGNREIDCIIVDDDDLHAELAMIDENLCRAELSPSDRARQTARRKALYLELHPETAHGSPGVSRQVGDTRERVEVERFTEATAKITGQSERAVQRDAARGEKVIPEALDIIRGTKLDTGTYLDKLRKLAADDQVPTASSDLASAPKVGGIAGRYQATSPTNRQEQLFERFIGIVDAIEALSIADLIVSAGRQRAVLGQRASGLADFMSKIMEAL
ncbi:ParB/RepB/Spo0J family partition protein [Bradyrhizobium sp. Arg314]